MSNIHYLSVNFTCGFVLESMIYLKKELKAISNMEEEFKNYLLEIRGMKTTSSVKEYFKTMPKVKDWFVENGLCDSNTNLWNLELDITNIQLRLNGDLKLKWKNAAKKNKEGDSGFMMATWNRWVEFTAYLQDNKPSDSIEKDEILVPVNTDFLLIRNFQLYASFANLKFSDDLTERFLSSLLAKPFIILPGLTGYGKTKLAQAFSMYFSESKSQYAILPVGADWTNREPLLGYPNSLDVKHYVKPDSGALEILIRAHLDYEKNNKDLTKCKPFFLILDEMNLSHVERYFADFLSTMESGDAIKLYSGDKRYSDFDIQNNPIEASLIPKEILLPKNLFIIGTVNIDETTYMFSPKVLDRANTIEFRISEAEMQSYFTNHSKLDMNQLLEDVDANRGQGASVAPQLMGLAAREGIIINKKDYQETFINFFTELQKAGAEFGYRTANEMTELIAYLTHFDVEINGAYDIAIMQKLLPKLNGSRSKLSKVIPPLLKLCENEGKVKYPLSHEKLTRMKKNADENGFASFAEA
jgi:hypothetical protein